MNKNRQRRHCFYYEKLKREKLNYEKFKEAVKAVSPTIQGDLKSVLELTT